MPSNAQNVRLLSFAKKGIANVRERIKQGFSLMEMMVVLLIVAIVAAASAPMVTKKMTRNAGSGDSPWVFTGLSNNISYLAPDNSQVLIGATQAPNDGSRQSMLYIRGREGWSHLRFGNPAGDRSTGITADPGDENANGRVGISNVANIPVNSVMFGNHQALGNNATGVIAIGESARVGMNRGIAIGGVPGHVNGNDEIVAANDNAITTTAFSTDSVAIGQGSVAGVNGRGDTLEAVAIGHDAYAASVQSIAIGSQPTALTMNGIAIGGNAKSRANQAIAIGSDANANNVNSIAIGNNAVSENNQAIAIGNNSNVNSLRSIAIGHFASATGDQSVAIGPATVNNPNGSGAVITRATGQNSVALGANAAATDTRTTAVGTDADATVSFGTAIGSWAEATAENSTSLGGLARANGTNSIAIGEGAIAGANNSIAIGQGITMNRQATNSVAIAANDEVMNVANQIRLGTNNHGILIRGNLTVLGETTLLGDVTLASSGHMVRMWGECPGSNWTPQYIVPERVDNWNMKARALSDHPYNSDRRLKDVGEEYKAGLEELKKLDFYHYTFKKDKDKTPRVGVMAQDLQKVFPDAVTKGDDGYLRIRWEDMFYAVINAVKELDVKICNIVKDITSINSRLDEQDKIIKEQQKFIEMQQKMLEEQQKAIKELQKEVLRKRGK